MKTLSESDIAVVVAKASPHSDRGTEGLQAFAEAFVAAHKRNPGGLSLEVGTRCGGSAYMFLQLLAGMYEPYDCPYLFTVDPYGFKPYNGGDVDGLPIYGDGHYLSAKKLLAPWPNHAHFLMRSEDFLERILGVSYWRPGNRSVPVLNIDTGTEVLAPLGDRHTAAELAFALLDGEHDSKTMTFEIAELLHQWMAPGGLIAVDNVDTDPKTRASMEHHFNADFSKNGQWAIVKGFK